MENEDIISVKKLIASIEENSKELRSAIKSGDEEIFNQNKKDTLELVKDIEDILNKGGTSGKESKK
jgi:hypothetical protein